MAPLTPVWGHVVIIGSIKISLHGLSMFREEQRNYFSRLTYDFHLCENERECQSVLEKNTNINSNPDTITELCSLANSVAFDIHYFANYRPLTYLAVG